MIDATGWRSEDGETVLSRSSILCSLALSEGVGKIGANVMLSTLGSPQSTKLNRVYAFEQATQQNNHLSIVYALEHATQQNNRLFNSTTQCSLLKSPFTFYTP